MPIEFQDLPQGTPSVVPVQTGTGYCSASTVAALNKPRAAAWGLPGNVTVNDVDDFILMVAGQIDAVLLSKGYSVPVNTASYPETEGLLGWVNAQGAAWMVEEASPQVNPQQVRASKDAFDAAMKALETAKFAMDVPVDAPRAQVRAPYVTYQPPERTFDPQLHDGQWGEAGDGISSGLSNLPQYPFFTRGMRF